MSRLPITIATWDYDRVRALTDGRVQVEGCDVNYITMPVEECFERAYFHGEFEVAEIGLSGQIDIGWSSPPLGVEDLEQGKIRLVARGSDVASLGDQTVRVIIANANSLAQKKDAIRRFMEAYNETIDWMYAEDKALQLYAEAVKVPFAIAKRSRDEFYPKDNLRPNRLSEVEQAMVDAIALKFLPSPLSKEQLGQFFAYQLRPML